ncbi:MAG: ATP-binding cassette domain-containing protein [Ruminococcus sp.]|nr:ATP-binding cassette domain-containing protein [Ruminococcus sp.]
MLYAEFEKKLDLFTLKVKIEAENDISALFGASGAGKSMTLKCIAGIEKPDRGVIRLGDKVLFDSERHINLSPQKRHIGYLFQEYALFPSITVRGNITAALHHLPRKDRRSRCDELMNRFHIADLSEKKPEHLSGGERQRVALARIFASEPEAILLDEPFSSLDTLLKWELIPYLKETLQSFFGCSIMVSHSVDEVLSLCNSVSVIEHGENAPALSSKAFADAINEKYASAGIAARIDYKG